MKAVLVQWYRGTNIDLNIYRPTAYKRSHRLVYPTRVDAEGAARSIAMLQIMYGLRISELANGTITGHYSKTKERFVEYVSPMSTNDCLEFSKRYYHKIDRSNHVAWLEEALTRYSPDDEFSTMSEGQITARIGRQYYFMEDWGKSIYWLEKLLKLKPSDAGAANALNYARRRYLSDQNKPKKSEFHHQVFNVDKTVMGLCRGDPSFIATNSRLWCYYVRGPHAFLLLAPVKAERLNNAPVITMFYDVISDREIEAFKINSRPLSTSEVVSKPDEGTLAVSDLRTSHKGCLQNCPEADAVERRMTQLTGLQRDSDYIQIANYGIGGYYSCHYDYYEIDPFVKTKMTEILSMKQRISTTLFYMSDVEQGGATVFPRVNLTVFPIKNAAIFWYNLNSWGDGDVYTIHSACPVLRGSKWVATKWPMVIDQDITISCPLRP